MKKIGDLMKELGFSPDSKVETQAAFLKNLVKSLPENRVHNLDRKKTVASTEPVQLSFDFSHESLEGSSLEIADSRKKNYQEVS